MPLKHYSDRHLVQLLATETRRTDTPPTVLGSFHQALGRFLAGELVEELLLSPCEIQHPQGKRQGWQIADENGIALLALMRSGLYVAEGVRELLRRAPLHPVFPRRNTGLDDDDLEAICAFAPHTCVVIDAVVNTGASVEPVLSQLSSREMKVFVLSLVSPRPTAERLAEAWPDVDFLFARVSDNQYMGNGGTDTGNRLFGTFHSVKVSPV